MTDAQWLLEYMLLREKEREKEKEVAELVTQSLNALKRLLVNLLGLNVLPPKEGEENAEKIIPLSLMTARREVLGYVLEQMDVDQQVEAALDDDEFEAMSQAIAKGEDLGDMTPLFEVDEQLDEQLNEWFTPGREQELRRLGVKIVDGPLKETAHHNVDGAEIQQKKRQAALERQIAKEEIEKQIAEEKKRHKSHDVKVTFDTDDA